MAKVKPAAVAEKTEDQKTATEVLNASSPAAAEPVTRESLVSVWVAARNAKREFEDKNPEVDPSNKQLTELLFAENKAKNAVNKFDAEIAAEALKVANEAKQKFADECKSVLFAHFGGETLAENEQTVLKARIDSVMTIVAPSGKTGSDLKTTTSGTVGNGESITARVKAIFDGGGSVDDAVKAGFDRKRASDIHWHWRKANG